MVDFFCSCVFFVKTLPSQRQTFPHRPFMSRHLLCLATSLLALTALPLSAVSILTPTDPIVGGVLNGDTFTVGVVGTAGDTNNWPAAEPPADLINGLIGGGGEKYLNFAKLNTGVVVTAASPSLITSITFYVANDAPDRDPAQYSLYGSNSVTVNPDTSTSFSLADFTLISSGALELPTDRNTETGNTGLGQTVDVNATTEYQTYMLVFPTLRNADATNSMQLSEIHFEGRVIVPEPTTGLLALCAVGMAARRRR